MQAFLSLFYYLIIYNVNGRAAARPFAKRKTRLKTAKKDGFPLFLTEYNALKMLFYRCKTIGRKNALKKFLLYAALSVLVFLAFVCLDNVLSAPLSLSFYVGLLYAGAHPAVLAVIFVSASIVKGDLFIVLSAAVQAALLGSVFMLYNKKKRKPGVETVVFVFLSSIIYLLFDKRADILYKLVYMAVISLFAATCSIACAAIRDKGLTVKLSKSETLSALLAVVFFGAGFSKLAGIDVYKGISVALVMIAVITFDDELPALFCAALCSVYVINYGQTKYALPYAVFFALYYVFAERNRLIAALMVIAAETAFALYFGFYGDYGYAEIIAFGAPQILFALLPKRLFLSEDGFGYLSVEQALNKTSFNAMRSLTASALNRTADSFLQVKTALSSLGAESPSDKKLAQKIAAEIISSCEKCPSREKCRKTRSPDRAALERTAEIGLAKKRISLIDLPKEILDVCLSPNSIIFEVNRLIDGFSEIKERVEKVDGVKNVLYSISSGMSAAAQKLSDSFSAVTRYDAKTEKALIKEFRRNGVKVKGLLVRGNGENAEVCVVYADKAFDKKSASKAIETCVGREFEDTFTAKVSARSSASVFTVKKRYACAYGVSAVTKYNSSESGDVYSVQKISDDKVFIALSDGMGSGKNAGNISDSAVSLIEAFYKAGFDSTIVLSLTNKILSFIKEDDFSAVDICVVDLGDGRCDFYKVGAPYGFILSKEGVRYLEGSSLPLGILDVLTPTVATAVAAAGDMILLVSDGVTDAFGSSAEMIEFLKIAPIKNPQEVADAVLHKALSLCGGYAPDDMTALCVRII